MRVPRIHTSAPLATGTQTVLGGSAARHLGRVLRAQPGAEVILFNGDGHEYSCRILAVTRDEVSLTVVERRTPARESPREVILVQGVSRAERMDYAIQKAVELGVAAIVPVLCERSVVRLDAARAEKRRKHWQSVVISACEQAGRVRVPEVASPVSLGAWLATGPLAAGDTGLVLDPEATDGLAAMSASAQRVVLTIGPEGGLSRGEIDDLVRNGFAGVRLGPRILRTETAAVTALSAVQLLWGDMGN